MTARREALADYLDLRHSLGFSLKRDAKLLAQFLTYLDEQRSDTVTTAAAVAWASLPSPASPGWLGMRLSVVRSFAAYLHTLDPATEVPPPGLLPGRGRRAVPYLYSDSDIAALLAQAERLRTPLRTATMQTLIGLLAVTGMPFVTRVGAESIVGGLGIYWIWGMRRGGFPTIAEPAEAFAVFVLLHIATGNPVLPLFGLVFRTL